MRTRHVVIEHEDHGLELGRDCCLNAWFRALANGVFAHEWARRRLQSLAMLHIMGGPPPVVPHPALPTEESLDALPSV